MYSLLIVDDEEIIREGMRTLIPWEELGVGRILVAGSARQALKILEDEQPQLLISDINMPEISGIELIEAAYSLVPKLRVLVLTGYDYFEYARDSLRLHVQDYLLKLVDEERLCACVRQQVEALREEEAAPGLMRSRALREQVELDRDLLALAEGSAGPEALERLQEHFRLSPDDSLVPTVMTLVPTEPLSADDLRLLQLQIRLFCMNEVDAQDVGFSLQSRDKVWIVYIRDKCPNNPETMLELQTELIRNEFPVSVSAAVTPEVKGLRALNLTEPKHPTPVRAGENAGEPYYARLTEALPSAREVERVYLDHMAGLRHDPETVRREICRFLCCLRFACATDGIPVQEDLPGKALNAVRGVDTAAGIELGRQFILTMLNSGEKEMNNIVQQARKYIDGHLNENLSVTSLAARMYVSPNYFSRLFKRTMNEGCNEYIVRKRMETARELLTSTDLSTGRIASMVGYNDTNYFSLAFRKNCGMTPTAWRTRKEKRRRSWTSCPCVKRSP